MNKTFESKMFKYLTKILLINIAIFFVLLLIIEIFFGYWFSKYNLGFYMREHRLKKNPVVLMYNNKTYNYTYKRNYYGFRGEEIEPSQIEAVIIGGSTTDERYKPRELTITENLNVLLKERGYKFNIVNAGIEGQSTYGHIYNFKHWFPKLKDFSPKLYIFYIGINDQYATYRKIEDLKPSAGNVLKNKNEGFSEKLEIFLDDLKSRSFFSDKIKKIEIKYFSTGTKITYDLNYFIGANWAQVKEHKNYKYVNYTEALKIHNIKYLKHKHKKRITNYLNNIEILSNYATNNNATPIFITQVRYDGLKVSNLFILNYSLIEYCEKRNLSCIDLGKKLNGKIKYWYDAVHTSIQGSKVIAEVLIDDLDKIIKKKNLF